jgi:hypothetical protein
VAWSRIAVGVLVVLSLLTPTGTGPSGALQLEPSLRLVSAQGVRTLLPPKWEFRPLGTSVDEHRRGVEASEQMVGRIPTDLRQPSLEAYWVDATTVGVPSDYYRLAARAPIQHAVRSPGCEPATRLVARSPQEVLPSGQYVATVTGTCSAWGGEVRWASFVAAPGFGPVRSLGIARSGLYVVRASVADGPGADHQLHQLVNGVSFGGTSVGEFLTAAGLPPNLP